jgi:hypothetical protein
MQLYARYMYPENGYNSDKEKCRDLQIEKMYKVKDVYMSQTRTLIELEDFPDRMFNSINFEFYHEINICAYPEYNPYIKKPLE